MQTGLEVFAPLNLNPVDEMAASDIIDLLEVWAAEARHPDRQREARTLLSGLGRQLS